MKEINVRITFVSPVLGTSPGDPEVYTSFIASKSPDASTVEDEVKNLGVDAVAEKGTTVFPKVCGVGAPMIYDYQIKGFFKDTCKGLKKINASKKNEAKDGEEADVSAKKSAKGKNDDELGKWSGKCTAYKQEIDKLIFVKPRCIPFQNVQEMDICQRPLRAQTAQGERTSLASSEQIHEDAFIEFKVECLVDNDEKLVREWLNYGKYSGLGQWRNSGKGRFYWEELDSFPNGNVIGGNKEKIIAELLAEQEYLKNFMAPVPVTRKVGEPSSHEPAPIV